jgi:prolyl-tRNA editing enzyme YbaK/EbsC (Cys-tRNA(Pro) deacylase)
VRLSLASVRQFFAERAPDIDVVELATPTSTVLLAAAAHHVTPGEIAKTLSLRVKDRNILVVTRGDARLDNKKAKAAFGAKARMLNAEEVVEITGHPVGGVCPFGVATPMEIFCDINLREFSEVVPAAGSTHSAVRISPLRMLELTGARWIDVCQMTLPENGCASQQPAGG